MSIYSDTLTSAERRALKKHAHDLQDEIDVLRVLILREMERAADGKGGEPDIAKIIQAAQAIGRLAATRHKLQAKPEDRLRQALLAALDQLDAEGE